LLQEGAARLHLEEWDLVSPIRVEELAEWDIDSKRDTSWLEISFDVRRKAGYYLTHVIAMVALLIAMGWGVFIVPPDKLDARVAIAVTLYLALLALNFVVNGLIPKISYSTYLTQYFVVGYVSTSLSVIQSMCSYLMYMYSNLCPDKTVDCWPALYFDWATLCVSSFCEIVYTIVFLVRGTGLKKGEHIIHPHRVGREEHEKNLKEKLAKFTKSLTEVKVDKTENADKAEKAHKAD